MSSSTSDTRGGLTSWVLLYDLSKDAALWARALVLAWERRTHEESVDGKPFWLHTLTQDGPIYHGDWAELPPINGRRRAKDKPSQSMPTMRRRSHP